MLQYSVYAKFVESEEPEKALRNRVEQALPPLGEVRLCSTTDAQFVRMGVFFKRKRQRVEQPTPQLALF